MERRLSKLQTIWPSELCAACATRPTLVCVKHEDDPVPVFDTGRCPTWGRTLFSVPILIGIDCDAL